MDYLFPKLAVVLFLCSFRQARTKELYEQRAEAGERERLLRLDLLKALVIRGVRPYHCKNKR